MHVYIIKFIGMLLIVATCITAAYLYVQASQLQKEIDAEKARTAGQDQDEAQETTDDPEEKTADPDDEQEDE